ncbi:MAG TPA: hypothetical protein DEB06_05710, partial [Phycisphaerales bacterium]|nr:hypothetical protein [Phycisphaerales bacterium]
MTPQGPERPHASITDFLTDASLAALCEALGELSRARVTLHDADGRRIVQVKGDPPWRVCDPDDAAPVIERALAHAART